MSGQGRSSSSSEGTSMRGDCHDEPSICPEWCVHKDAGLGYHRHSRMSDEERHEWGLNDTPESRLSR